MWFVLGAVALVAVVVATVSVLRRPSADDLSSVRHYHSALGTLEHLSERTGPVPVEAAGPDDGPVGPESPPRFYRRPDAGGSRPAGLDTGGDGGGDGGADVRPLLTAPVSAGAPGGGREQRPRPGEPTGLRRRPAIGPLPPRPHRPLAPVTHGPGPAARPRFDEPPASPGDDPDGGGRGGTGGVRGPGVRGKRAAPRQEQYRGHQRDHRADRGNHHSLDPRRRVEPPDEDHSHHRAEQDRGPGLDRQYGSLLGGSRRPTA